MGGHNLNAINFNLALNSINLGLVPIVWVILEVLAKKSGRRHDNFPSMYSVLGLIWFVSLGWVMVDSWLKYEDYSDCIDCKEKKGTIEVGAFFTCWTVMPVWIFCVDFVHQMITFFNPDLLHSKCNCCRYLVALSIFGFLTFMGVIAAGAIGSWFKDLNNVDEIGADNKAELFFNTYATIMLFNFFIACVAFLTLFVGFFKIRAEHAKMERRSFGMAG